jgi:hypothetical protein
MLKINDLNWTFCQFKQDDCTAVIHQGGENTPDGEYVDLFYVNVLKQLTQEGELESSLYKEIHQEVFPTLDDAINYINSKFSHWNFINQLSELQDKSSGGCGSCVAH